MPRTASRAIAALVALALWLGYGAAAERWPAIDIAHGLGSNLIFGRGGGASTFAELDGAPWRALDGDTFLGAGGQRIRVLGVDTPELHPCRCSRECELGGRARRLTQALLDDGPVSVQPTGHDRYGRTLARVTIDGRDLGAILIRHGLGRPYGGAPRQPWCS